MKVVLLSQGSHILFIRTVINMAAEIVHHPNPGKTEECQSEDTCGIKKRMKLRFSLTMLSEEDVETGGHRKLSHPEGEWEDEDIQDDCFDDDDDLLVSLANMSFNLVDEDPDTDKPFCSCDHQFNEIVIMPEQADLTISQIGKLIKEQSNLFLKSNKKYIASEHNRIQMTDTMSARITIFQCKATTDIQAGVPVVLNFTGTDNFFSCTNEGEEKILKITSYDKKKLHNSADDPEKLALVFYMSQKPDGVRHFESALHRGWFIHTADGDLCKLQEGNCASSNCFVLIETDSTKTIKY